MAGVAIRTENNGKLHITNYRDESTGLDASYTETSEITTDEQLNLYGGVIFKKDSLTGKYLKRDLISGELDLEMFRNGNSDWATIQTCFNFIRDTKNGYSQYTLRIPSGKNYVIEQPLYLNTFAEVNLIGAGIRKSSITAGSNMETMIYLGIEGLTPFRGRCRISGVSFNASGLSSCIIDMIGTRYSTLDWNEFVGLKDGGIAVKIDGWVQKIQNNIFSNQLGTPNLTAIKIFQTGNSNNINITKNSISTYSIGLHCDDFGNSINVTKNSFDFCDKTGVYLSAGARGISVENNYFEACGKTGLTITKGAPGSAQEIWKGAIIAHHYYAASTTWVNGLVIKKNQFSNCSDETSGLMTLAGLENCIVEENFTHYNSRNKYFVDLRWTGSLYTKSRNVKIIHTPAIDNQFDQLIGLNSDNINNNTNNLIIRNNKQLSYINSASLPIWNNPFMWGDNQWLDFHEDELNYNGNRTYCYRGNSGNGTKILTVPVSENLKGQYYRVNWFSKGTPDAAAGFTLVYKVDGVTKNTFTTSSLDVWVQGGRNATIYIPVDAIEISFTFSAPTVVNKRFLNGFSIAPSSYEIEVDTTLKPTSLNGGLYLVGGDPNGFQKGRIGNIAVSTNGLSYKKTTVASDLNGWVQFGDKASDNQIKSGTSDSGFVTPKGLRLGFSSEFGPRLSDTSATITDFNNPVYLRAGINDYRVRGLWTNGPGDQGYYNLLVYEYGTAKDGTGNLTQMLIPLSVSSSIWIRHRSIEGTFSPWIRFLNTLSDKKGVYTVAGSSQTTIVIPHGLEVIPSVVSAVPQSLAASTAGITSVAKDVTNITVTVTTPQASGSMVYSWDARI